MSESNDTKIAVMQTDISTIKEDMSEMKSDLKEFIKNSEERFASKWVEKVMLFIISTVGLGVIGAVLSLIFIK